jgi:hypothetical protein
MAENSFDEASAETGAGSNPKLTSIAVGAFLALLGVSVYSLFGLYGAISVAMPYVAGVGMFVALLSVFGAIIATLKRARKTVNKQILIHDCFIAVAVIGVMGYLLAACVQTFQPGGNPADYWTYGGLSGAGFLALFFSGQFLGPLFNAGQTPK